VAPGGGRLLVDVRERLVVHVHELNGGGVGLSVEWKQKEERHVGLWSLLGAVRERARRMGAVLRGLNGRLKGN